MISSQKNIPSEIKKAILITYPAKFDETEISELTEAACYKVVHILSQKYLSKAKFGLGEGKAKELEKLVNETDSETIIFDSKLKTTQIYNLAKLTRCEIIDRERLILEIFSKRAKTKEAKLQVELAELAYEIPRAKERVRLAKNSEQPGFYGLGKYEVDVYTRALKKRISSIKSKLRNEVKRRELHRLRRSKIELPIISLAGYTGVGKTTLFNRLTKKNKLVSSDYFTTLTTSTSSINIEGFKFIISDTVGFISRLPTYMVEAFKSTLEELVYSSHVLLMIDISKSLEDLLTHYHSCVDILNELQVSQSRILIIFNKTDLVDKDKLRIGINRLGILEGNCACISAATGKGIDKLLSIIRNRVIERHQIEIKVDKSLIPLISHQIDWLRKNSKLEIKKLNDGDLILMIIAKAWVIDKFKKNLKIIKVGRVG